MARSTKAWAILIGAVALALIPAMDASAHVVPTSTVVLDVHDDRIDAQLRIPASDLIAASGIDLGNATAADLSAHESDVAAYIEHHIRPSSATGGPWAVTVDNLAVTTDEQVGTGAYRTVTATAHLVAPQGADQRVFSLGYDVILDRVVTHTVIVSVGSDWLSGTVSSPRELGTIHVDSVTGKITALSVNLGNASPWNGLASMFALGMTHIRDGVDHQLFLLTLLLPAPLVAVGRRWGSPVSVKRAIKRITAITLAFTVGHSITLALGAVGVPVIQQLVEALIAVSIVVAAAHALRPIFPGKELLVAGGFGLVHGLAFSQTLTELDLSGGQLALSLLGFNLGIEAMQLIVVALVLPPLIVLARTRSYPVLRSGAAVITGLAAIGWFFDRIGVRNALATAADGIGAATPVVVVILWIAALIVIARSWSSSEPSRQGMIWSRQIVEASTQSATEERP